MSFASAIALSTCIQVTETASNLYTVNSTSLITTSYSASSACTGASTVTANALGCSVNSADGFVTVTSFTASSTSGASASVLALVSAALLALSVVSAVAL